MLDCLVNEISRVRYRTPYSFSLLFLVSICFLFHLFLRLLVRSQSISSQPILLSQFSLRLFHLTSTLSPSLSVSLGDRTSFPSALSLRRTLLSAALPFAPSNHFHARFPALFLFFSLYPLSRYCCLPFVASSLSLCISPFLLCSFSSSLR